MNDHYPVEVPPPRDTTFNEENGYVLDRFCQGIESTICPKNVEFEQDPDVLDFVFENLEEFTCGGEDTNYEYEDYEDIPGFIRGNSLIEIPTGEDLSDHSDSEEYMSESDNEPPSPKSRGNADIVPMTALLGRRRRRRRVQTMQEYQAEQYKRLQQYHQDESSSSQPPQLPSLSPNINDNGGVEAHLYQDNGSKPQIRLYQDNQMILAAKTTEDSSIDPPPPCFQKYWKIGLIVTVLAIGLLLLLGLAFRSTPE